MRRSERAILRNRKIGFIFQNYNLLAKTTAVENVELPLMYNKTYNAHQRREAAIKALQAVGLGDRLEHKSNQMSGGQMQRVAIARALVNGPPLLIADEPTGNLDPKNSLEIMQILEQINQRGITVIVSTHDYTLVDRFRKRVLTLEKGEIIRDIQAGTYGQ